MDEQARLREVCSKCRLGEGVAGGGGVSLDRVRDGTLGRVAAVAPGHRAFHVFDPGEIDERRPEPDEGTRAREALSTLLSCVAALPYGHVSRLAAVADEFRGLTRQEFGIVAHLLDGGTMTGYAEANGLSKQTAFARIKALFEAHPVFRSIANGRLTRGRGGRKATPRRIVQPDLFAPPGVGTPEGGGLGLPPTGEIGRGDSVPTSRRRGNG